MKSWLLCALVVCALTLASCGPPNGGTDHDTASTLEVATDSNVSTEAPAPTVGSNGYERSNRADAQAALGSARLGFPEIARNAYSDGKPPGRPLWPSSAQQFISTSVVDLAPVFTITESGGADSSVLAQSEEASSFGVLVWRDDAPVFSYQIGHYGDWDLESWDMLSYDTGVDHMHPLVTNALGGDVDQYRLVSGAHGLWLFGKRGEKEVAAYAAYDGYWPEGTPSIGWDETWSAERAIDFIRSVDTSQGP